MYFELFLADDLLLNLLILRLAAALLSVRPPTFRMIAAALSAALVSAAAAFLLPILRSVYFRIPLLALMALGLPAKSFREFLRNAGVTLFSTFVAGGCAVVIALLTGGGFKNGFLSGGISLRLALLIALAVSFLPSAARRILRRKLKNGCRANAVLLHDGRIFRFRALVDTGNSLSEPVTGLPVAVVRSAELARYAKLPIPCETAAGSVVLRGFRPERFSVDGRETDCIVAVAEGLGEEAIVPLEMAADKIWRSECGMRNREKNNDKKAV